MLGYLQPWHLSIFFSSMSLNLSAPYFHFKVMSYVPVWVSNQTRLSSIIRRLMNCLWGFLGIQIVWYPYTTCYIWPYSLNESVCPTILFLRVIAQTTNELSIRISRHPDCLIPLHDLSYLTLQSKWISVCPNILFLLVIAQDKTPGNSPKITALVCF